MNNKKIKYITIGVIVFYVFIGKTPVKRETRKTRFVITTNLVS